MATLFGTQEEEFSGKRKMAVEVMYWGGQLACFLGEFWP